MKIRTNHQKLTTILLVLIILVVGTASQAGVVSYKAIDLTPSRFDGSMAFGTSGTQQVGWGYGSTTGGKSHALLWKGSADSFTNSCRVISLLLRP